MIFKGIGVLAALVMVYALACDSVGIGGKCHDSKTGEVLEEVEDADGKLWPVSKHPQSLKAAGQQYEFCGVSIEAATETKGSMPFSHYVYHPETGEVLGVGGMSNAKRMRTLNDYEWY